MSDKKSIKSQRSHTVKSMTAKRLFKNLNSDRLMLEHSLSKKSDLPPFLQSAWKDLNDETKKLYINRSKEMVSINMYT